MAAFTALRRLPTPTMSGLAGTISKSPSRGAPSCMQHELCCKVYAPHAWVHAVSTQDARLMTRVSLST